MRAFLCAVFATVLGATPSAFSAPVVGTWDRGVFAVKSIDAIAFASDGVLLISDGQSSQIVAFQTQDIKASTGDGPHVSNIVHEIAARIGIADKGAEIANIVVNPASGRVYLLVKNLEAKNNLIVSVDSSGEIAPVNLNGMPHAIVKLPSDGAAARA